MESRQMDSDLGESEPILCNQFVTVIPDGEDLAFKAVRENNLDALQKRLSESEGLDVNSTFTAATTGSYEDKLYTISDFPRMKRQIRLNGYTMLHVAVAHGTVQTIQYLLSEGANVNSLDLNFISPLSIAAATNRPDVVKLLLDNGASVNAQTVSGRTPLIMAINNKNVISVRLLIAGGADVELSDLKGTTPLFTAIDSGRSPLDVETVQTLIDGGCSVDRTNSHGATALMFAVGMARRDIILVLLESGANINMMDKDGKTAFDHAIGVNTAKTLMAHGATTDWLDRKGKSPLDRAAHNGHVPMMRLLLSTDCRRSTQILNVPRVVQVREQLPLFNQWLQNELYTPRNLKRLCRQAVRHCLSPHNTVNIKNLPIPWSVKDFLLGKDYDPTAIAP